MAPDIQPILLTIGGFSKGRLDRSTSERLGILTEDGNSKWCTRVQGHGGPRAPLCQGRPALVCSPLQRSLFWTESWKQGLFSFQGTRLSNTVAQHSLPELVSRCSDPSPAQFLLPSLLKQLQMCHSCRKNVSNLSTMPTAGTRISGGVWMPPWGRVPWAGRCLLPPGKVFHALGSLGQAEWGVWGSGGPGVFGTLRELTER